MKRFFKDFESIDKFSLSLDYHQNELTCAHCSKNDQFISHGIVYKQRSMLESDKVGKRLFCSNRYGRTGCGRTFQLYIASEIPHLLYTGAQVFVFISALLANMTLVESYLKAIGKPDNDPRNAWRWLDKLNRKLTDYRVWVKVRTNHHSLQFKYLNTRFRHLLPTLAHLISKIPEGLCSYYQIHCQCTFI
jgi:hypothetical protein